MTSGTIDFVFELDAMINFALTSGFMRLRVEEAVANTLHEMFFQATPDWGMPNVPLKTSLTITRDFTSFLDVEFSFRNVVICGTRVAPLTCDGSTESDALLRLAKLIIRDENGNVVTDARIAAESGFNYNQFLSEIPEPTTGLLAATSIAMGLLLRKMHRRSS